MGLKEELTVLPSPDWHPPETTVLPEIFLVGDLGEEETKQAHALEPGTHPIDIANHTRPVHWGCVFFGVIYERTVSVVGSG